MGETPYSEKTIDEKFSDFVESYKCECKDVDSHGCHDCHDCQNTGFLYDSAECDLILSLNQENEKLKQFQEEVRMCIPHIDEKISGYEKLRKCVEFYGKETSWITKMLGVADLIHEDDIEQLPLAGGHSDWNIGGKLARQTLKELNNEINNTESEG